MQQKFTVGIKLGTEKVVLALKGYGHTRFRKEEKHSYTGLYGLKGVTVLNLAVYSGTEVSLLHMVWKQHDKFLDWVKLLFKLLARMPHAINVENKSYAFLANIRSTDEKYWLSDVNICLYVLDSSSVNSVKIWQKQFIQAV